MSAGTRLAGQVAVVTGASAGIGAAVARALAAESARVALAARREDRLQALAAELEGDGAEALAVRTDVARRDEVERLVDAVLERWGRLDVVVANAGIMPVSPVTELRVDDWTRMVDVNVKGVLHTVGAALPPMLEAGRGHLVTIGSLAGRRPFPGGTVYSATKFAVRALVWGLHLELGAVHGIRVTDVQPGFVATELLDTVPDPDLRRAWLENWGERRPLQPEDVARAVIFAVTAPEHVAVNEVLVRPLDQPT